MHKEKIHLILSNIDKCFEFSKYYISNDIAVSRKAGQVLTGSCIIRTPTSRHLHLSIHPVSLLLSHEHALSHEGLLSLPLP